MNVLTSIERWKKSISYPLNLLQGRESVGWWGIQSRKKITIVIGRLHNNLKSLQDLYGDHMRSAEAVALVKEGQNLMRNIEDLVERLQSLPCNNPKPRNQSTGVPLLETKPLSIEETMQTIDRKKVSGAAKQLHPTVMPKLRIKRQGSRFTSKDFGGFGLNEEISADTRTMPGQ